MRKIQTVAMVCAMLAATSAFAQGSGQAAPKMADKPSPVAEALMKKEEAMLSALQKKNFAEFQKMTMPTTWSLDGGGYMSVADFMKAVNDPKSDFKWDSYKTSEMKVVTIDANAALVTYKLEQKGSFMGQPFASPVYATSVWANHGGMWMAMFHQETTAAPPAPPAKK